MSKRVVKIDELEAGIVQVTMQDQVNKNAFSNELIRDLGDAFDAIRTDTKYKAVILIGYDNYFASGATQETLFLLAEGQCTFADIAERSASASTRLYSLALNCPIPVISAMQGHGIGGGFIMGLFGDFVLLSRESIYTANFMKYGFTPGMGATLVLPYKLGPVLAEEMLLTGKTYNGDELQKRGVAFPVIARSEVAGRAVELARILAEKPRLALVTLKDNLVAGMRDKLPAVIEQELVMHKRTFSQSEVRERIRSLFGN